MNKVIMLSGPPASGKTTVSKQLIEAGAELFSPDKWLEDTSEGKYNWTPARAKEAWALETQRFQKWLMDSDSMVEHNHVAVWDATFVSPKARRAILNFAKGAGCRVEAWVLNTPYDLCLIRNAGRMESRRVPTHIIDNMFLKFVRPTIEEGFDEVKIIDGGK